MKNKTAFLFAGQGAQFVGMGVDFFDGTSGGIYDVMRNGPAEELNKTINAQPAIYLHDLAAAEALRQKGVVPDCVAGFSLGEIPALVFAGAMSFSAGHEFVSVRAAAMQSACEKNPSTMFAVIRLGVEKIEELAGNFEDVWVANYNSPEQVVCSCSLAMAEAFSNAVTAAGGRTIRLKVSGAFHSPLMFEARKAAEKWLHTRELRLAKIPVYSNWTGQPYVHDYKERIALQIQSPVLWQDIINNMLADGVRTFVEVGPGTVLSGLVKKIIEASSEYSVFDAGAELSSTFEGVRIFSVSDRAGVERLALEI